VHLYDRRTHIEETLRPLDDVVRAGKVRYVGCWNFKAWQTAQTLGASDRLGTDPLRCMQNRYNLLHHRVEDEIFGLVRERSLVTPPPSWAGHDIHHGRARHRPFDDALGGVGWSLPAEVRARLDEISQPTPCVW
jgi:aryl-alcohol dehydrogenase (NADP+)